MNLKAIVTSVALAATVTLLGGTLASAAPVNPSGSGAVRQAALPANSITNSGQVAPDALNGSDIQPLWVSDFAPSAWAQIMGVPYNTVGTQQLKAGAVMPDKLSPALQAKVNDTKGQITGLEADGPYPGSTKLQDFPGNGANSTEKVPADSAAHAVWVQCADGKTALGGGFRLGADQGDAVASKIQVTASEPTQIKDGAVVYAPIDGDLAGSVEPNGWLVEVINTGTVDATVRPWVTCAKIAK